MTNDDHVVILTALHLEYNAVAEHLDNVEKQLHHTGTRFTIGAVRGTNHRVALGVTGVGNGSAAVLSERAMQMFGPTAVLFVGVAGSLGTSAQLGDVVVASHVYAYHGGTSDDDGFKSRPRSWEADHGLYQLARDIDLSGDWTKRLSGEPPKVHFKPIAAGEVVQNSRSSAQARMLHERYNDAAAIEMEAAGIAQAGHLGRVPVGIVRGISDHADGTKNTDNDGTWQPRAAAHAAAFAVHLAAQLAEEKARAATSASSESTSEDRVAAPGDTVYNWSSGSVGIQGSRVSNNTVWMNTAPATVSTIDDVRSAITGLRAHLDRGHLDEDVRDEAHNEIAAAESALREPTDSGKKKTVLALKKLAGLVDDNGDLAGHVAQVRAAVDQLP